MKLKVVLFVTVVFAAVFLMPSQAAQAQNVYAAIHGTVTDSSGAVVPNASVAVVNTSTNITTTATTDSQGYYTLPQLQVGGPYSVTIAATGFRRFTQSGLTLNVNDNRDVDAKLEIGSGSTTVQVSATALQVETSDSQLKQVVTAEQLEQIPLLGRDPAGLQKLQAGVVESSDRFGSFSTDGSQTPQNSFILDGVDINDGPLQQEGIAVNPDALQEENIIASTLNPEFARNSGATVNEIIKSGSNQFHGSVFEFYRDTFLNATPYFSLSKPEFHQNLYGGTLGGPVIHDKLFFFTAYQGYRNVVAGTSTTQTLDSSQFAGQFSDDSNYAIGGSNNTPYCSANTGNCYSDGLTENPLPFAIGNCPAGETWAACFDNGGSGGATVNVAPGGWNPVAAALTAKYVQPANVGTSLYTFNANDTNAADQGVIRVDFTPTSRDTIWASSVFQSSPSTAALSFGGGSFPGFGSVQAQHFKIFSAAYTHTFSSTMLNELRLGYYRFNFAAVEPENPVLPSSIGFTGISPQDTSAPGVPFLSVGSYFSLGNSYEGPQPRLDTNLSYGDNFTKIVGAHSLKFGASYEQFRVDNPFAYLNNGYFYYDGGGLYSSGDPLIDYELGIPDGYEQTSNGRIDALAAETYAYVQDSWKASSDLTLNFGISWDVEAPNLNDQFSGLGINCWSNSNAESTVFPGAPPGLTFPGDKGCNRAGGPVAHYNRFGPRMGFAWSPSSGPSFLIGQPGSHEFSVRGGYGVYYNRDQEEQSLQNLEDPPFLLVSFGAGDLGGSPSFTSPFNDVSDNPGTSEPNKFPYAIPTPGDTNIDWAGLYSRLELATFDAKRYTVPYAQNFNLNIQRSLPSNMLLQIGYVGTLGHNLASWYDGDNITAAGHAACAAGATLPGYPASTTCNSASLRGSIHTYFPQFTADPAIVPGTGGGAIPSLPNGLPWYTSVAQQTTEGASNYNALQITLIKARTHGLSGSLAYTYSHGLDNGSGYESTTGALNHAEIYTPGYTYLNYGDSDYDARHRLAASYIYEVPVFSAISGNPILRETLAGWELAGITAIQTGFPVGISQGQTRSLWCDGSSYFGCGDVPDTSSYSIKSLAPRDVQSLGGNSGHYWFDPTPFSSEPVGTYGNVKRNFFHGPGFNYTDLAMSKNFRITQNEQRYIQLRIEAANAFNHANFAPPDGTFTSGTFGQVTGVQASADPNQDPEPARVFQLVGKIYF
ncbi:MAG: carboxypeptidase-like regulatory domain-containing protein [Silvibacterium sp.]